MVFVKEVCGVDTPIQKSAANFCHQKKERRLQPRHNQKIDALTVHELEEAETEIIKVVQTRCFYDELLSLQGTATKTRNPSKIKSVKK